MGLTQGGLLVVGVEDRSPAGEGGLLLGDIIAMLDGRPVEDTEDLLMLLTGRDRGRGAGRVLRGGEPRRCASPSASAVRAGYGSRFRSGLRGRGTTGGRGAWERRRGSERRARGWSRCDLAGRRPRPDERSCDIGGGRGRRRDNAWNTFDGRTFGAEVTKRVAGPGPRALRLRRDRRLAPDRRPSGTWNALRTELVLAVGHPLGQLKGDHRYRERLGLSMNRLERPSRGTASAYGPMSAGAGEPGGPLLNARVRWSGSTP